CGVGPRGPVLQGPKDTGAGGDGAAEGEQPELGPGDRDPGEAGRLVVVADVVQGTTDRSGVQQYGEHHGQPQDRHGDPGKTVDAEEGCACTADPTLRITGHGTVTEQDVGQTSVQGHGADRHCQRGKSHDGDQEAVEGPQDGTTHQTDEQSRLDGDARLPQHAESGTAQGQGAGHGQVDLTGDDHKGH